MCPFRIDYLDDMDEACRLVRAHRLFLDDESLSHTLFVVAQHEDRERLHSPLLGAWVARSPEGEILGCALASEGLGLTDGAPAVSLFVLPQWRGQGMGTALLDRALDRFPNAWGFYTPEAQDLYERRGLEMAFFSLDLVQEQGYETHQERGSKPSFRP